MSETEKPAEARARERVAVTDARVQFPLRRAIDGALDRLIRAGADKVLLLRENRTRDGRLALSRSQVKNVVNVATGTSSREALTNFIRYQMGRQGGDPWRHRPPGGERNAFGREVIADLESAGEGAAAVVDAEAAAACERVTTFLSGRSLETDEAELRATARARLAELYLGYLNRTYAYCEAMDRRNPECWQDVAQVAERGK